MEINSLPRITEVENIKSFKLFFNDKEYCFKITQDDLISVQYINERDQIVVRRGRIKDIVAIAERGTNYGDNSRIILDCSEQYTVKIIEVKINSIIEMGDIDKDDYKDYSNRKTDIEQHRRQCRVPVAYKEDKK